MLAEGTQRVQAASAFDAPWRARAALAQEEALPEGPVVVSCPAPFGVGGLGRHLHEGVDALERRGQDVTYICEAPAPQGDARAVEVSTSQRLRAAASVLARLSP